MTNEATPVEGPYEVHDWTVASGTAIDKGTLCMISGSRTAAASAGASPTFAGIAASDKSVTDGDVSTELGLAQTGTFLMSAALSAVAITEGMIVSLSGSNLIKQATSAELLTGDIVGKALQGIAADATATGEVKIGVI